MTSKDFRIGGFGSFCSSFPRSKQLSEIGTNCSELADLIADVNRKMPMGHHNRRGVVPVALSFGWTVGTAARTWKSLEWVSSRIVLSCLSCGLAWILHVFKRAEGLEWFGSGEETEACDGAHFCLCLHCRPKYPIFGHIGHIVGTWI